MDHISNFSPEGIHFDALHLAHKDMDLHEMIAVSNLTKQNGKLFLIL